MKILMLILISIFVVSCEQEHKEANSFEETEYTFSCKLGNETNSLIINTSTRTMQYSAALYNFISEDDVEITAKCDIHYGCNDIEISFNKITGKLKFTTFQSGTNDVDITWDENCKRNES